MISSSTALPCIAIQIFNSDVFILDLYHNGSIVDRYINDPHYFEKPLYPDFISPPNHFELWEDVLAPSITVDQLSMLWNNNVFKGDILAEDILNKFIPLLGLSPAYTWICTRPPLYNDDFEIEGSIKLFFVRSANLS